MNKKPGPIIKSASQKYNPKRSVSCTVCSKIFSEVFSLHRHMRMKHLPRQENCFPCLFCQQSYSRTSNLSKHYRDAHPESLKFQCGKCGKRYATNARCLQHIRKNHGLLNEEIKVKDLDEELFVETANSVPEVIQPQLELTPLKESPKETTKSKISAEEDGNFYTILDDTPGRGLYCCDVCNVSTFTKINALRRHWKTKPHKENAEKHKAQLNLKKPVKPKSPKDNGNLTQKLTCSVCLKVFFNTVGFVQHRLTHFNREQIDLAEINILNPYECEICHKVFTHHQRVQTHLLCHMKTIKTVHPASKQVLIQLPEAAERQRPGFPTVVEKPIESYIISAKKSISGGTPFKPVSPLDQTLYTCALCSSTFGTKYLYGAHVRHSCPKQVHCQYCSLSFTNLKNLRQHLHKCNHKKNLACKYCFLKFQSLNDLGWHEKGCVKFYEPEAIRDSDCAMSGPNDNHKLHCVTCGQDIPNFEGDYLQGHLIIHPKEPIKITCLTCNMFFNDKTDIYDHTNELSHLSSYVERCPVPLVVPNTWNSVVHRDKMVTSSPVGNMILDSNKTTACQSDNSESYFSKCSVSNTISKSDTKYSIWNNDDTKRLRSNFSQLMYLLISDPEVLASFGWGSRAIDGVLKDILVHLGQEPFVCNNDTREIDNLRSNIKLFMSICIKDDVMQAEQNETVDGLVARMLTLCSERD